MALSEPPWIGCVVTCSRLGDFRAFVRSVRRFNPAYRIAVLVVDGREPVAVEGVEVVRFEDLGMPEASAFAFQYDAFELCNALKAHLIGWLLDRKKAASVLYMDCDMGVFDSLDCLTGILGKRDLVLTPHFQEELPRDGFEPSLRMLGSAGVFNAGIVGVAGTREGRRFVEWWKQRVRHHCIRDTCEGLFVDQRHLDFVPAQFPGLEIVRHRGVNVAHFNLHERRVRREGGRWWVDADPLVVFHFTSVDYSRGEFVGPVTRPLLREQPLLREIIAEFEADRVAVNAAADYSRAYGLGTFASGRPISPDTRVRFREWWKQAGGDGGDPFRDPHWEQVERGESLRRVRRSAARVLRRVVGAVEP